MPYCPVRTPEPIVNYRNVNIYRLNNVVCTIYEVITYNLYADIFAVFLYQDACYILEDILGEYSLNNNEVSVILSCFHYSKIVNIAVSIQIEV